MEQTDLFIEQKAEDSKSSIHKIECSFDKSDIKPVTSTYEDTGNINRRETFTVSASEEVVSNIDKYDIKDIIKRESGDIEIQDTQESMKHDDDNNFHLVTAPKIENLVSEASEKIVSNIEKYDIKEIIKSECDDIETQDTQESMKDDDDNNLHLVSAPKIENLVSEGENNEMEEDHVITATLFTKEQLETLKERFRGNKNPTLSSIEYIAEQLNVSRAHILLWLLKENENKASEKIVSNIEKYDIKEIIKSECDDIETQDTQESMKDDDDNNLHLVSAPKIENLVSEGENNEMEEDHVITATLFSKEQLEILKERFRGNKNPTLSSIKYIAEQLNVSRAHILLWLLKENENKGKENPASLNCASTSCSNEYFDRCGSLYFSDNKPLKICNPKHKLNIYSNSCNNRENLNSGICPKSFKQEHSFLRHISNIQSAEKTCYKCDICNKQLSNKHCMALHLRIHSAEETYYKCDICNKQLSNKHCMALHLRIHSIEESYYKCDICNKQLKNKYCMVQHIKIHSTEKTFYQCDICKKKLSYKYSITQHQRIHFSEKIYYKCDICKKQIRYKHKMARHMRIHSSEKNYYKCDICGTQKSCKEYMAQHMKIHSAEKTYYMCDICNKQVSYKYSMAQHMKIHSSEKNYYKCDICNKQISYKSDMAKHMKIHSAEKTYYMCDICNKQISYKYNMAKHMRIHSSEKNYYKCDICGTQKSCKEYMAQHMKIHSAEKTYYMCDICNKQVSYKYSMAQHMKIHSSEKNYYKCDICNKQISYKSDMAKHMKIHSAEKTYYMCDICNKQKVTSIA